MKLGVIARAEDRGLGLQSWEAVRALAPERVLVIDVQNAEGFPLHLDRYPGATVARLNPQGMNGYLAERLVRDWLDGLDVVLSFETLYDWRLAGWARDTNVATVVQANPEFFQHHLADLDHPTVWWNPTTWRMEHLPAGTRHVPVPVALDRFRADARNPDPGPLRVLHVGGRAALGDRNGVELLHAALRRARQPLEVTWTAQRQRGAGTAHGHHVGEVADYWRLYDGQDVLVLPRRYGGLCLPTQEAMAAGLAVVMPGCPPNLDMWPVVPVTWRYRGQLSVPCGTIPLAETDAKDLAATLDRLAADPACLAEHQARALEWATGHSWDALRPLYLAELAAACDLR